MYQSFCTCLSCLQLSCIQSTKHKTQTSMFKQKSLFWSLKLCYTTSPFSHHPMISPIHCVLRIQFRHPKTQKQATPTQTDTLKHTLPWTQTPSNTFTWMYAREHSMTWHLHVHTNTHLFLTEEFLLSIFPTSFLLGDTVLQGLNVVLCCVALLLQLHLQVLRPCHTATQSATKHNSANTFHQTYGWPYSKRQQNFPLHMVSHKTICFLSKDWASQQTILYIQLFPVKHMASHLTIHHSTICRLHNRHLCCTDSLHSVKAMNSTVKRICHLLSALATAVKDIMVETRRVNVHTIHIRNIYRTSSWTPPLHNQPLQKFQLHHASLQ